MISQATRGAQIAGNARLRAAVDAVQRQWGSHALTIGAGHPLNQRRTVLSTGFPELDAVLALGGVRVGALVEVAGWATSGAHSLALRLLAQAQAAPIASVYLDLCASFRPSAALRCGIRLDDLLLLRPRDAVQAGSMMQALIQGGGPGTMVVDTTSADESSLGTLARVLRRLRAQVVNGQWLVTLLVARPPTVREATVTDGLGADLRIHLAHDQWLYRGQQLVGYTSRATVSRQPHGPALPPLALSFGSEAYT
jgi:hypothetical protein